MARPSRLQIAKADIIRYFTDADTRIYRERDLGWVLDTQREFWRAAQRTSVGAFIEFLCKATSLKQVVLKAVNDDSDVVRYVWETASPYELALSLKQRSYLSHASAIFIHNLSNLIPKTIYLNCEQSPKLGSRGVLTQESLDRAFNRPQRASKMIYEAPDELSIVVINGKHTQELEVETVSGHTIAGTVRVTTVERTLIDCVVRPGYSGGLRNVLDAYVTAQDRVSTNRMRATLKKLGYVYPYHQAIGFLLQRAGYASHRIEAFRELGMNVDFYLTHGIENPEYDREWRLFVPKGF